MVPHVCEVEVDVGDGKVDLEGDDLLSQEQEVLDDEELCVQWP